MVNNSAAGYMQNWDHLGTTRARNREQRGGNIPSYLSACSASLAMKTNSSWLISDIKIWWNQTVR